MFNRPAPYFAGLRPGNSAPSTAVVWEVRYYVIRARNPVERRELLAHGIVYGVLMASYVGILVWSKHDQWTSSSTLAVSAVYAAAIILLGVRRHRIHRRHRPRS